MNNLKSALGYLSFHSPLGWILLAGTAQGICLLQFCGPDSPSEAMAHTLLHKKYPGHSTVPDKASALLLSAQRAIELYFTARVPPANVPLDMQLGTRFQQQVWQELCAIPFGQTRTYGQIAAAIGRQRSARAVGQACGRNPIPIIVPCHRVLATGGKLGGYSGGLHIKQALLEIEGIPLPS